MKPNEIGQRIKELAGKTIFSCTFIKRTNGEERKMICRLGVQKDLSGTGRKFDPYKYELLSVFDIQKQDYRFINLRDIRRLKIRGIEYIRESN